VAVVVVVAARQKCFLSRWVDVSGGDKAGVDRGW